jgi:hypothetical protein
MTNETDPASVDPARAPSALARIRPLVLATQAARAKPAQGEGGKLSGSLAYPPEVIATIEAEWRAGLTPVSRMAKDSGIPTSTIYAWSVEKGWGERAKARAMAREAIDSAVIQRAVDAFREQHPAAAEPVSSDARTEMVLADYALVVAEVVEAQRAQATDVVKIGTDLIAMYRTSVEVLAKKYAHDELGQIKLVQAFITTYSTLIRSVAGAQALQRAAYGLNAPGEGGGDTGSGGEVTSWQPGTYDDIVREAEARGERLA